MRAFTLLTCLMLVTLICPQTRAEDIVFMGKTMSPEKYDIWSPHAGPEQMKVYQAMVDELKAKRGDVEGIEDELPYKPFTGKIIVQRLMADIGQQVGADQPLLTYTFPPEEIQAERRKLSETEINSMEAGLARVTADMHQLNLQLEEFRHRVSTGTVSSQQITDKVREIEVAGMKLRAMRDSINFEKEMNRGELELARAKYGPKTSSKHLPLEAYVRSPVNGYVLWSNPDLKAGAILDKQVQLFSVGRMDPILIRALVHEMKLPKLHVGDAAAVTFESMPGKTFTAHISRIAISADQSDAQMPSHYQVELTLPNPGIALKEGLRGQVTIAEPDTPPKGGS